MLSKSLQFVEPRTQMQTLTKMNKVVIEDYYHMITMDETNTCLVKCSSKF